MYVKRLSTWMTKKVAVSGTSGLNEVAVTIPLTEVAFTGERPSVLQARLICGTWLGMSHARMTWSESHSYPRNPNGRAGARARKANNHITRSYPSALREKCMVYRGS